MIEETHDPTLKSWVESANREDCDFPIQNLPLGVFRTTQSPEPRLGAAIGDFILPLSQWLTWDNLNGYMSLMPSDRRRLRCDISKALESGSGKRELVAQSECEMLLPASIGDYTDFYASIHHAQNVGSMFRPDNPLLPNYRHVPIAYHGRSSSIVVSGTAVRRPVGQLGEGQFGPTKNLDYELELGAFLGPGNAIGESIPIDEAEQHIAGVCLVNDWSARDIQRWEYQPLGPFLAKNFATSISPWLITMEALEPFRASPAEHHVPVLPYLQATGSGAFEITLEVRLRSEGMIEPMLISRSHFKDLYWTLAQMIAHHSSNGCPLRPGDLIASGTVSGPEKENRGCLLERTWRGSEPIQLPTGEQRSFLEDGDEVIFTGYCAREGFVRIGLGNCRGTILPARRNHYS
ncbi:MAG: fumarylacetoacetase [Acidobacteriaceae bacterium]|nr:fumarylacetoacetase [Acidobacteriaceae bacterium]MBV9780629.1 fumarylacetoacetase [Acidobacteriaceae bacterium]